MNPFIFKKMPRSTIVMDENVSFFFLVSATSSFEDSAMGIVPKAPARGRITFFEEEVNQFSAFVERRISYIDSLSNLSDGWISGNSKKPDKSSLETCKEILFTFMRFVNKKMPAALTDESHTRDRNSSMMDGMVSPRIPKILLGPLPSGGMGMEFHVDARNALYITIPNKPEKTEVDVKFEDCFSSLDYDSKYLAGHVIDEYKYISR